MNNRFIFAHFLHNPSEEVALADDQKLLVQDIAEQAFAEVQFHRSRVDHDLRDLPVSGQLHKVAFEANQIHVKQFTTRIDTVAEPGDAKQLPKLQTMVVDNKAAAAESGLQAYVAIFEIADFTVQQKDGPKEVRVRGDYVVQGELNVWLGEELEKVRLKEKDAWVEAQAASFVSARKVWVDQRIREAHNGQPMSERELNKASERVYFEEQYNELQFKEKGEWKDEERSLPGKLQEILKTRALQESFQKRFPKCKDLYQHIRLAGILNWTTSGERGDRREKSNRKLYLFPKTEAASKLPSSEDQLKTYVTNFVKDLDLNSLLFYSDHDRGEALLQETIGTTVVLQEAASTNQGPKVAKLLPGPSLTFSQIVADTNSVSLYQLATHSNDSDLSEPTKENVSLSLEPTSGQEGDRKEDPKDTTVLSLSQQPPQEQKTIVKQPKFPFYLLYSAVTLPKGLSPEEMMRTVRSKSGKIPKILGRAEYQTMELDKQKFLLQKTLSAAQAEYGTQNPPVDYCIVAHVLDPQSRLAVEKAAQDAQESPDDLIDYQLTDQTPLLSVYHPKSQKLVINANGLDAQLKTEAQYENEHGVQETLNPFDFYSEGMHVAFRQSGDHIEANESLSQTLKGTFVDVPKKLLPDPTVEKPENADAKTALSLSAPVEGKENMPPTADKEAVKLEGQAKTVLFTMNLPSQSLRQLPPYERVSQLAVAHEVKVPAQAETTEISKLQLNMRVADLAAKKALTERLESYVATVDPKIQHRNIDMTLTCEIAAHPFDASHALLNMELIPCSRFDKRQKIILVVDPSIASSKVMDSINRALTVTARQNPATQVALIKNGQLQLPSTRTKAQTVPVGSSLRGKKGELNEFLAKQLTRETPSSAGCDVTAAIKQMEQDKKESDPDILTKVIVLVGEQSVKGSFTKAVSETIKAKLGDGPNTQVYLRAVGKQENLQNRGLKPEQIVESADVLADQVETAITTMGNNLQLAFQVTDEHGQALDNNAIDLAEFQYGLKQPILMVPRKNQAKELHLTFKTGEGLVGGQLLHATEVKDGEHTGDYKLTPVPSLTLKFPVTNLKPNPKHTVSFYRDELHTRLKAIAEDKNAEKAKEVREFKRAVEAVFPKGPKRTPELEEYFKELERTDKRFRTTKSSTAAMTARLVLDSSQAAEEQPGMPVKDGDNRQPPKQPLPRYLKRQNGTKPSAPAASPEAGTAPSAPENRSGVAP